MIQNTVIAALFAVATLAAAPVKVDFKDAMGKPVGTATIREAKTGGVLIHMKLMGSRSASTRRTFMRSPNAKGRRSLRRADISIRK